MISGQKISDYLLGLYDTLLWRLARGALRDGMNIHALRLANLLLITGPTSDTSSSSSSSSSGQRKRGSYESLGWRLRAVAACGAGKSIYASQQCRLYK
jgi:hypothetical protein